MDTASAHNDAIDKTENLLEQKAIGDEIASKSSGHEPAADSEAPAQPAEASPTPPTNG